MNYRPAPGVRLPLGGLDCRRGAEVPGADLTVSGSTIAGRQGDRFGSEEEARMRRQGIRRCAARGNQGKEDARKRVVAHRGVSFWNVADGWGKSAGLRAGCD